MDRSGTTRAVILVGTLLAVAILALPCQAELTAAEILVSADAARAAGSIAQAKELYAQVVTAFPEAGEAAVAGWRLGWIAYNEKDFVQSERQFQWVADNHPATAKGRDSLLRVAYLAAKEKRPDALQRFLDVTLRYPDSAVAQMAKSRAARLQTRGLDLDAAAGNFKAAKDSPKGNIEVKAEAAALEGMTYLQKYYKTGDEGILAKGITTLQSVQEQFPKSTKGVAWSRFRLGIFYIHEGRKVKDERYKNDAVRGRQILQDAVANLPFNYFTWWMKAEVVASYIAEGADDQVVAECRRVLAENPPASWDEYITYLLGSAQIRLGQTEAGVTTFQQLVGKYPAGEWADAASSRLKTLAELGEVMSE